MNIIFKRHIGIKYDKGIMQSMKQRNLLGVVALAIFFVICTTGCSNKNALDYSKSSNWAYYVEAPAHDVDIFFITPTAGRDESYQMRMDDEEYKAAFIGATAMEKGIYDAKSDFYAPFYRQVSLECYDLPQEKREKYLDAAYDDIDAAFNYYIKNKNQGRPYILAGFSQGGDMIKRLLMNNKNIDDKMIAAYAIGWYFSEEEVNNYPNITMAKGEDDTGVVISFCSEAPEYDGESIISPVKSIEINPLNWRTDCTQADKNLNLGSCFTDYSGNIVKEIPNMCGAYLDEKRGTLKVTEITPEEYPAGLSFLEEGNYHLYDYQFFYRNLQKNVETRIAAYNK